jgi:hypothetical protein
LIATAAVVGLAGFRPDRFDAAAKAALFLLEIGGQTQSSPRTL